MRSGYARVSTQDKNLALHTDALLSAGAKRIFTDTATGSNTERPGLKELFSHIREGDCVIVWRLDRIARSLKNLIDLSAELENPIGRQEAKFVQTLLNLPNFLAAIVKTVSFAGWFFVPDFRHRLRPGGPFVPLVVPEFASVVTPLPAGPSGDAFEAQAFSRGGEIEKVGGRAAVADVPQRSLHSQIPRLIGADEICAEILPPALRLAHQHQPRAGLIVIERRPVLCQLRFATPSLFET